MTVKLLCDWKDSRNGREYKAGNLLTTDAGTETGLIAQKIADATLTGGTPYVIPTSGGVVDRTPSAVGKLKKIAGAVTYGNLTLLTNSGSGYTYSLARAMPGKFKRIQICVANNLTSGSVTYGPASVSVGPAPTAVASARNNSAVQVPILFGGSATVTVAAAAATDVTNMIWSDWADIDSADLDEFGFAWAFARIYAPTSNALQLTTSSNTGVAWNTHPSGRRVWSTGSGGGDFVTNPAAYAGGLNTGQNTIIAIRVELVDSSVHTVAAYGDSIFAGAGLGVGLFNDSFLFQGSVAASSALPCWVENYGFTGKTTANALTRFLNEIDNAPYSSACFEGYSPNDGSPTEGLADAAFARVLQFIRECAQRRIVPIIFTPAINSAWTTPQIAILKDLRIKIRALQGVCVVADIAASLLSADELSWIGGASTDGIHPNDHGISLAGPVVSGAFIAAMR